MRIQKPERKHTFTVTCTAEEKEEAFRQAQESGRTVSGYVRWLIKQNREGRTNDRD